RQAGQDTAPAARQANYRHLSLLQAAPVYAPGRLLAQRQRALAWDTMGGHPAGAGGAAQRLRARGGMVQTKSSPALSWRIRRLSGGNHGRSGAVDAGRGARGGKMALQLVVLGVLLRVRRVRPRSAAVAATAPQCPFGQRLTRRASRTESERRMTAKPDTERPTWLRCDKCP